MSHNIPESDAPDNITPYHKDFSIGCPDPNFVAKVVDPETWEELPPNTPGMMLVKSNSVTVGYYQDQERTRSIFKDGWYITGDIAKIDEDNFIFITGRETRISKIGGEMAPHAFIEEKLQEALQEMSSVATLEKTDDDSTNSSALNLVVTAVPDERKGEKLVVLYVNLPCAPEELCKRVSEIGTLPQLWIPSPVNFKQVPEIPVLGTGKLNLKEVRDTAKRLYGLE